MRVMGTGSRSMVVHPKAKEIYANLRGKILIMREKDPDLVLISGLSEGWDEAIAKVGMRENIPYEVYIPHPTYGDYYWGRTSLLKYDRMLEFRTLVNEAQKIHYSSNGPLYINGLHVNFIRNQDMVDTCDSALVYNATSSGTRDAVGRLKKAKKPYEIAPFSLQLAF